MENLRVETTGLTPIEIRKIFYYFDGKLFWLQTINNRAKEDTAAGWVDSRGYIQVRYNNKYYRLARLIWMYHFGEIQDDMVVDHKDGNKLNNNIDNLRLATYSQSTCNTVSKENSTGFRGVRKCYNKFSAYIRDPATKKRLYLGSYNSAEEASEAYQAAAESLHGDFSLKESRV